MTTRLDLDPQTVLGFEADSASKAAELLSYLGPDLLRALTDLSAALVAVAWSFSASSRALACPPSVVLPQVRTPAGEAADLGTRKHTFFQNYAEQGRDRALALLPANDPLRGFCEAVDLGDLFVDAAKVLAEFAIAYDPINRRAIELPKSGQRGYVGVPRGWIPGTLDLVVVKKNGEVWAYDHKTGRIPVNAKTSGQMAIAAASLAALFGASRVHVGVLQFAEDGTFPRDNIATFERMPDDGALDLDAIEAKIEQAYRDAARASLLILLKIAPSVTVGDHCDYCPAVLSCPAYAGALRWLLQQDPMGPDLTPEEAGKAWQISKQVETIGEAVKRAAKNVITHYGHVPATDGRVLRVVPETRESIGGKKALEVLQRLVSDEEFLSIVTVRVTKASILEHLPQARSKELLRELEIAGAVVKNTYTNVKAVKANPTTRKK